MAHLWKNASFGHQLPIFPEKGCGGWLQASTYLLRPPLVISEGGSRCSLSPDRTSRKNTSLFQNEIRIFKSTNRTPPYSNTCLIIHISTLAFSWAHVFSDFNFWGRRKDSYDVFLTTTIGQRWNESQELYNSSPLEGENANWLWWTVALFYGVLLL